MAHFIVDDCTGCGVCRIKCPVKAITGEKKDRHSIDVGLCIDCGVCGKYCAFSSIVDSANNLVQRVKPKEIPKAIVTPDECSGCESCVFICPFDAISLYPYSESDRYNLIALVNERKCVGCRMCEELCIKEAITVPSIMDRFSS